MICAQTQTMKTKLTTKTPDKNIHIYNVEEDPSKNVLDT